MVKLVTVFVFFPLISAQDAGLDALAAVISRQKIMGQEIGNELDEQNGKVLCVCVCLYIFIKFQTHYTTQCESSQPYLSSAVELLASWTLIFSHTTT